MRLREATPRDSALLLGWRNDPDVRAASRSRRRIGSAEHERWLRGVIRDPLRHLLIAEEGGEPVGQLRLDRIGEGVFEVSISVRSESRGGTGGRLLREGIRYARKLGASGLEAVVRNGNERSLRLFQSQGFEDTANSDYHYLRLT